jgi:alkanesulfonate monooxygenase SsuD/methylene tetrahydromethanopterin reductase-like flavin-dependent oxidoreductase (luciferase family)
VDIGIGLPAAIPWLEGPTLADWARRAEASGFSTLGTIDRIAYGNAEPLTALGVAAGATERIGLTTAILIAPARLDTVLLAKQTASLDALSGGRLTLGLAVGGREDDFEATGAPFHERGKRFDAQLVELKRIWGGETKVGPAPARRGGPSLILGGSSDKPFRRVAEHADGWIAGGGPPQMFAAGAARVREEWARAGREGAPKLMALAYFGLGPNARAEADRYLHDYYAFIGPIADQIAAGAAVSEADVREQRDGFAEAGCDELIYFPVSPDPEQVDLLAAAVAGG